MSDQLGAGWNFDVLGDAFAAAGAANNDNAPPTDAYVVKDIDQVKQSLIAGGRQVGESAECVALVKEAVPGIGPTRNWREGTKINAYSDPPLEPGTALATFRHGKYPNNSTGNHAAIFLKYEERNAFKGWWCWTRVTDMLRRRHSYDSMAARLRTRQTMPAIIR